MIKKIIKRALIGIVSLIVLITVVISVLYFIDKNKRLKELESNSQLAETSAGTIEYKIYGDEGPVILYAHEAGSGYDAGEAIPGYRVLVPSRSGYLRTPLEVGKTPEEQARAYSALLEALDIEKVYVYGASAGGPSAICFAAIYPEKISSLILLMPVSQSLPPSVAEEDPFFIKTDFSVWALCSLMQNDSVFKSMLKSTIPEPDTRQLILKDSQKIENFKSVLWHMWPPSKRSPGEQNDLIQIQSLDLPASKIKVPTLIMHGSEDKLVPVSHSKKLAEQIPGSKLVIIEGVDHIGIIAKSEELEKISAEFMENVDAENTEEEEGNI